MSDWMEKKSIPILLIEDNPGDARLVRESLSEPNGQPFDVIWVQNLAAGLAHLSANSVDAILLDLTLPDSSGLETFCQVRDRAPDISTILLTGLDDEAVALEAVRSGAQDYLRKGDACGNQLERTIRYAIERKRIERELRESENRFHRMAENVQDGIIILEDGSLTFFNERICEIFGYSRDEMGQQNLWTLLTPEETSPMHDVVEEERDAPDFRKEMGVWVRCKDGAHRYLQSRFSVNTLESGEKSQYIILTDITERKLREDELKYLSFHDVLTGLYNRAYFEEAIARLERGRQYPVSVIMGDVDGLKRVNDVQGHAAGDDLLRLAAQAIRGGFRAEDIVARIGGDEFAALLPHTDAATAALVLKRIQESVAAHAPLSFSLGVATVVERGGSLAEALKQADQRLYEEKASKRKLPAA
jgi:two-component system, cell cycle response regulator